MLKTNNLDLKINIELGSKDADLIIVNSHKRSGIHYLINTIDHIFGLISIALFSSFIAI